MADVAWPKGSLRDWHDVVDQIRQPHLMDYFDLNLAPEVQTDKSLIKVLPCQYCRRPLIVSTFYVPAWAKCGPCKGETSERAVGSVEVAQAGRTEPRLVKDLTKVLINPVFGVIDCPFGHGEMELKAVYWSENYGPSERRRVEGREVRIQTAPGETVMHQCQHPDCYATVTLSTTAVTKFRRINEPKPGKNANQNANPLGTRDDNLSLPVERDFEMPNPDAEPEEAPA